MPALKLIRYIAGVLTERNNFLNFIVHLSILYLFLMIISIEICNYKRLRLRLPCSISGVFENEFQLRVETHNIYYGKTGHLSHYFAGFRKFCAPFKTCVKVYISVTTYFMIYLSKFSFFCGNEVSTL